MAVESNPTGTTAALFLDLCYAAYKRTAVAENLRDFVHSSLPDLVAFGSEVIDEINMYFDCNSTRYLVRLTGGTRVRALTRVQFLFSSGNDTGFRFLDDIQPDHQQALDLIQDICARIRNHIQDMTDGR